MTNAKLIPGHPLDRLIVAVDVETEAEALPLLDVLAAGGVRYVKIGPVLMLNMGMSAISKALEDRGIEKWFFDPKFYNTDKILGATAGAACAYQPTMLNSVANVGPEAIKDFVSACADANVLSIIVTVLTTKNDKMCQEEYGRTAAEQVLFYVNEWIKPADADGIVCSALEAPILRKENYKGLLVTPGVRFGTENHGDQKRVATPAWCFENGSDYPVMGTDILIDPSSRLQRFTSETIHLFSG